MKICALCGCLVGDDNGHRNLHTALVRAGINLPYNSPYFYACPMDGSVLRRYEGVAQVFDPCGHPVPEIFYP